MGHCRTVRGRPGTGSAVTHRPQGALPQPLSCVSAPGSRRRRGGSSRRAGPAGDGQPSEDPRARGQDRVLLLSARRGAGSAGQNGSPDAVPEVEAAAAPSGAGSTSGTSRTVRGGGVTLRWAFGETSVRTGRDARRQGSASVHKPPGGAVSDTRALEEWRGRGWHALPRGKGAQEAAAGEKVQTQRCAQGQDTDQGLGDVCWGHYGRGGHSRLRTSWARRTSPRPPGKARVRPEKNGGAPPAQGQGQRRTFWAIMLQISGRKSSLRSLYSCRSRREVLSRKLSVTCLHSSSVWHRSHQVPWPGPWDPGRKRELANRPHEGLLPAPSPGHASPGQGGQAG